MRHTVCRETPCFAATSRVPRPPFQSWRIARLCDSDKRTCLCDSVVTFGPRESSNTLREAGADLQRERSNTALTRDFVRGEVFENSLLASTLLTRLEPLPSCMVSIRAFLLSRAQARVLVR